MDAIHAPTKLKATVSGKPRYIRSGRVLVVPCLPHFAGDLALPEGALSSFRERFGDPIEVLWKGRTVTVVLEWEGPLYIGKARKLKSMDVPGAGLVRDIKKFNADTIRRREAKEAKRHV